MPGGKANIESTDPPANPKPDAVAISELHEAHEEAEEEPREQENDRGLQEHRLGLGELLDGIEGYYCLREAYRVVIDPGVRWDRGLGEKQVAAVRRAVQQVPRGTGAEAVVVSDGVSRARHCW